MARLHDTHCHVDLYRNYQEVIDSAERAEIYTLAVTNIPSVFPKCIEILAGCRFLRPALGLHPELVEDYRGEITLFAELLDQTRYVGEVGLDFKITDEEVRDRQKRVFEAILKLCADKNKILTVHSRGSAEEVVEMVGRNYPGKVILHWYSGSLKTLLRALEYGLYFSVNPAMLRSKSGLKIVKTIPTNRILLETDGPFVQVGSGAAEPSDVRDLVKELAAVWNIGVSQAEKNVHDNFKALLQT